MDRLLEIGLANAVVALMLAVVALLVSRWSRRPALVHALWLLVLIKLVTPPILPLPLPWWQAPSEPVVHRQVARKPVPVREPVAVAQAQPAQAVPAPMFTRLEDLMGTSPFALFGPDMPGVPNVVPMPAAPPVAEPAPPKVEEAAVVETEPEEVVPDSRLPGVVRFAAVVWFGGAAVWLMLTCWRVARFQSLLRHAKAAPAALQEEAERVAKQLGLASCPRIWLIPGPVPPLLWAIGGKARLFFPQSLLPRLQDTERATLLAHELAHMARRDHWVRLLELFVAALYWWYPLVWLACRQLQAAEEECCDAWVVHALPGSGTAYAGALVETVDFLAEQPARLPPAASGFGHAQHLKRRLTMIVHGQTPRGISFAGKLLLVGLMLALPLTPSRARPPIEDNAADEEDVTPVFPPQASPPRAVIKPVPVAFTAEEPDRYQNNPRILQSSAGGRVWAVAVSPDGKTVAVVTGDPNDSEGSLTLYDLASGAERVTLMEPKPIRCVAYSADGKWLATGDFAQKIQLRDPQTGEVKRVLQGHTGSINSVAFTADSQTLVSASLDKTIRLWDLDSGKTMRTLTGHTDWVLSVAISRDGKTIASGSKDETARIWDAETGKERHVLKGHSTWVEGVAIGPDGNTVATASRDVIKLWDATTGQNLRDLAGHGSIVATLAFFAEGRSLASCSHDRTVRFWDVATGQLTDTLETEHTERLDALALSPDEKTVVTGAFDRLVKVWDRESRELRHTLTARRYKPENNYPILSVAVARDGQLLAVCGEERAIKILDPTTGQLKRLLEGHEDVVSKVAFAPDGKTLASASFDGTIKLWDPNTGKCLRTLTGHTNWVFTVAFSPDGKTLTSGGYDKTVRLWDVATGKLLRTLDKHRGGVRAVAFSPDGQWVASGGADHSVRVWNVETGDTLHVFKEPEDSVRDLAFSPDGLRLVCCGEDTYVRLFDVATGKQLQTYKTNAAQRGVAFSPQGRVIVVVDQASAMHVVDATTMQGKSVFAQNGGDGFTSVAFAPDARHLYAGGMDRAIRVWQGQLAPRQAIASFNSTKQMWFAAYSPDGKWLAMSGEDKTLQVRDVRYLRQVGALALEDAPAAVFGMATSPDGTKLAAACFDKSVRVWDVKTRKLLATFEGMKDRAWMVAFSSDGKRLAGAAGSLDKPEEQGEVKVWEVESKKELLDLRGVEASCMSVAWSPDDRWLAVGTRDGLAKLYDATTGKEVHVLKGHKEGTTVRAVCFSPDSRYVATGATDGTVRVWDTETSKQVAQMEAQKSGVNGLDWSRDGKHLAAAQWPASRPEGSEVRLWQVEEDEEEIRFKEKAKLVGHKGHVLCCAFAPDGKTLASGGGIYAQYGETMLWDVESCQALATLHGHTRWVEGLTFAPDGKTLITGGGTHDSAGEVRFWNVFADGGWKYPEAHQGQICCAAWSPDGKTLATGSYDRSIKFWDVATATLAFELKDTHKKHLRSLSFAPDGKTLASSSDDETVKLWDLAAKKEIAELARHPMQVTCVAFSKDGKFIATASGHTQKGDPAGDVRVFEVETGKELENAEWAGKGATSVAFSPDGEQLVTGSVGANALRIYDVGTGKLVRQVQGANSIRVVAFSADGKTLASAHGPGAAYGDGSVQVWNTDTWTERAGLVGHASLVLGLSFSPDGKTLATASNDKTVKIWDVQVKTVK